MSKRNRMPGLRQKGDAWHIEKRCSFAPGGWLRESTGTSSRNQAEQILIRRLAELEEEARRHEAVIFTFEEAGLRYLEEIAHKSSAKTIAMNLDQLFPFIGTLPISHVHDGTIRPFIEHEQGRGQGEVVARISEDRGHDRVEGTDDAEPGWRAQVCFRDVEDLGIHQDLFGFGLISCFDDGPR